MAVARGSSNSATDVANSFNISITGDLVVILFDYDNGSSARLSSVTVDGTSMTRDVSLNEGNYWLEEWSVKKTVSGSQTVVLTWVGSTSSSTYVYAFGYTGAGGVEASNSDKSISGTMSVTTLSDNAWLVGMGHAPGAVSVFAGSTRQNGILANGANTAHNRLVVGDSNGAVTPAGSTSQVYTVDGTNTISKIVVAIFPSTSYTVTIAQGSYTYTGYAVALFKTVAYVLSLAQGSYSYTGYAVSFVYRTYTRFINQVKNVISPTNTTKNSASTMTNTTKSTSTWTNQDKN